MAGKLFPLKALTFLSKILLRGSESSPSVHFNTSNNSNYQSWFKGFKRYMSLVHESRGFSDETVLVFNVESALLRSCSRFPYFMLVAFEAGGLFRALVLLLLHPFLCLVSEQQGLKIMVFVCFLGLKKETFRIGSSVLHKFFLEDVGREGFDAVMSCGRRVAVTDLPRVMVEGFLKDYIGVEAVIGRDLKVVHGYFVGLMDRRETVTGLLGDLKMRSHAIGLGCLSKSLDRQVFKHCEEVYLVTEAEKRNWQVLPRKRYLKPLIFHDGRLAFRPTFVATFLMFMWFPLGFLLCFVRVTLAVLLPYRAFVPILAMSGIATTISKSREDLTALANNEEKERRRILYVCNHRTLLDPVHISVVLMKPIAAVTYSLSRFNEVISPIKTVRLTREREKDRRTMEKMLKQSDLVVCPEGTTCREPYLLRFSPLFAEMSEDIVPVAIQTEVSMFYGSTASGFKCLDSAFHMLNPYPTYSVKILGKLTSTQTCKSGGKSSYEVANQVQREIANALGYECTNLTRKDKYMILAGNNGII